MDKKEAIERLQQALAEIPQLRQLIYSNQRFKLWCKNVETILKNALDINDYDNFSSIQDKYFPDELEMDNLLLEENYLPKLNDYEIALKSIIRKYEILGIEGEENKGGKMKKMDKLEELRIFFKKLRSYQNRQRKRTKEERSEPKDRSLNALRMELQRYHARLRDIISQYGGEAVLPYLNREYEVFSYALGSLNMRHNEFTALDGAISLVNKAIARLESMPIAELEVQGEIKKAVEESPIQIFDAMQFHTKIIKTSRSLFENQHYAQAIFEAFKAVENFVKEKSGSTLYGKNLMATVFNEDKPIVQVPEAGYFDKDVQEGFKFLFMGASQGIRNPKAHKEIVQNDPYITLEYLGFASFLLKRIDYWEAGTT